MRKEDRVIAVRILKKMHTLRKIGASHTPFENLPKGFPKHLRGDVKDAAKVLIREGLLLSSKHNYGLGVSLNPARLEEIEKMIEEEV